MNLRVIQINKSLFTFSGVRGEEVGDGNELRGYNRENNKSPKFLHLKDIKIVDTGEKKGKKRNVGERKLVDVCTL